MAIWTIIFCVLHKSYNIEIFSLKIMLTLQASIQNGIRQQPQIPPKAAITKQSSHANLPFFFSTRVTIWFPHPGHLHSAG
jgi:hypothetical protein